MSNLIQVALLLSSITLVTACNGAAPGGGDAPAAPPTPDLSQDAFTLPSGRARVPGIAVKVVTRGDGLEARTGDTVAVHYTGTFPDGKKFDSSRDRGEAFEFRLGKGNVISGWDMTVARMHVGDRWTVKIPPALAYGADGYPPIIPPNADLLFDIELLRVR